MVAAATAQEVNRLVLNVGSGEETSVREVANQVLAVTNSTAEVMYNPRTDPPTMEIKDDRALYWLEAPVKRVTGYDVVTPYFGREQGYIPSQGRIRRAIEETLDVSWCQIHSRAACIDNVARFAIDAHDAGSVADGRLAETPRHAAPDGAGAAPGDRVFVISAGAAVGRDGDPLDGSAHPRTGAQHHGLELSGRLQHRDPGVP